MRLQSFFNRSNLNEGGNLSSTSPGWQGSPGDHEADEIDLKLHNRDFMVGKLKELFTAQNAAFQSQFNRPIWNPKLLASNQMFSGSSIHFFDIKKISTDDFLNKLKKQKVGDIDTQVDIEIGEDLKKWLTSVIGRKVGNGTLLGFNASLSALWQLEDPPVKVQVDYELGPYDQKTKSPTEWFSYSHSSDYADLEQGIKGVFHKYINRALTQASSTTKYVARVLKKSTKISDEPVTDNDYSFAVTGPSGGGLSQKYKPYIDPTTGKPMEKNGIPVMQLMPPDQRDYVQNLDQQFQAMYGSKRSAKDRELQSSFIGTIQLMNSHFTPKQNQNIANAYLDILFGPGAQMLTKDDPTRDRDTKFASVDYMMDHLKLPNAQALRQQAVKMAMNYESTFKAKRNLKEADETPAVKAQFRKGMPHLHDLKPADFLDLLDEIHDGNGNFKLQNIPLNVKVDGFGGRFGKNAEGKPFMATSRTEPRYAAGFVAHHQKKGTTDPEILSRAQLFDDLFDEMMQAVAMVDSRLGEDFLINKQVTCEVLYLPFATKTDDGRLKFVGIAYDELPKGVQLALVPFRVVDATTGEDLPDTNRIVNELTKLGQQDSVMFVNNSLVQNDALDVTALVPPLENLEELKRIVSGTAGRRDRASLELRRSVEAQLQPIKEKLEQAIINDPNIIGKDMLGKDYEGIVINSRLGPIKVTSQEQRDVITAKNAAKTNARTERPRGENKTAVVAIGSFIGHVGHQELFNYTINKAKELGGDPYLFIGNAEGKNDPIPVTDKVKTWHMEYPQYANNISAVTQQGGNLMQKIKHELINPLPGKPPRYDNIVIMVGEDQANMPIANALMKAVNKFQGYEHVKVSLEVTPRGTGMSGTELRKQAQVIAQGGPAAQGAFEKWVNAFNGGDSGAKPLPVSWIKHLIQVTQQGMGITGQKDAPVPTKGIDNTMAKEPQQPVAEQRLFNAIIRPLKEARMSAAAKLSKAWDRQRAKSDASLARTPSSIPKKEEPKKDSATKEGMMPASTFTGSKKNKLGPAGQWKNTGPKKNSPAKQGDLVGGNESVEVSELHHIISRPKVRTDTKWYNIMYDTPDGKTLQLTSKMPVKDEKVEAAREFFVKAYAQKGIKLNPLKMWAKLTSTPSTMENDGMGGSDAVNIRKPFGGQGEYTAQSNWRGMNIGESKQVPVSEDVGTLMGSLINKILVNEAVSNNKR